MTTTRKWPPAQGVQYVGKWPPSFKGATTINRLRHLHSPLRMVGYPHSYNWDEHCKLNYAEAMIEKLNRSD